ncbi:MAG: tRNA threonylcarbamoyladenosine dehydratase [Clostridia bacterium]|nr:tRNA threonylcarbamoyladenosine dehydratase [Clostridia bacterium]
MEEFSRTEALLGDGSVERLSKKRVIVFGVGGVGGYVCEALARSGIGQVDVVDNDTVAVSNLNRQIIALHSTLGQYKVDAVKARMLDINPNMKVNALNVFYSPETVERIDLSSYDYVVDAIDTVKSKIELCVRCKSLGVPIISSMGAGNKLDPCAFKVSDIYKTSVCPLARVMRGELKKRGVTGLKVVYSEEKPISREIIGEEKGKRAPASCAFVPSVVGLIIASEVVKDLVK